MKGASSSAALSLLTPYTAWGAISPSQRKELEAAFATQRAEAPRADDPTIAAFVAAAVDAARAAGATYADARFQTQDWERWGRSPGSSESDPPLIDRRAALGVRALYNASWGYAAVTVDALTLDQAAAAGRSAIAQAKTGARSQDRAIALAPMPTVANGTWTTPIVVDPFTVSWDEKNDFITAWQQYIRPIPFGASLGVSLQFLRETQTFASSEGAQYAQTLYRSGGDVGFQVPSHWRSRRSASVSGDKVVSMNGGGWEYLQRIPFEQEAATFIARANDARLADPVDVGRYDVVFDGAALAKLTDGQLGFATELDRAMGYLANRDGTSYLNDPMAMLGTFKVGSPLLNVTANRSMPGGVATVKWDDEGVEPDIITLVKDGILTDFQTTRESAAWLTDYYQKTGKPLRSHGGATRGGPRNETEQGASNLVVAPAKDDTSFDALCSGIKKGLAVFGGRSVADQQQLNAECTGDVVYEIVNGKLGRTIRDAVFWTRAPEFWNNLIGLGGPQTVCTLGLGTRRQGTFPTTFHTVAVPAAAFKQVAVVTNGVRLV